MFKKNRSAVNNQKQAARAFVHCVIIGFSSGRFEYGTIRRRRIFDGDKVIEARNINGYLIDAENVFIESRSNPLCDVPSMTTGNRPADGGNLIIEAKDYEDFVEAEPDAAKYIKKLVGSEEFINNKKRYCLWLVGVSPSELRKMPKVMERVTACRENRLAARALYPDNTLADLYDDVAMPPRTP